MLKWIAYVFAVIFIGIAFAGEFGFFMKDGALLGVFALNSWHNLIHALSGVAAAIAGFMGNTASMWYFRVFGVVYLAIALMGLFYGPGLMFGYVANNYADVGLHVVLGGVATWLGFCRYCSYCKK